MGRSVSGGEGARIKGQSVQGRSEPRKMLRHNSEYENVN